MSNSSTVAWPALVAARDEHGAHHRQLADDRGQAAARLQLRQQGSRHLGDRAREHDHVERAVDGRAPSTRRPRRRARSAPRRASGSRAPCAPARDRSPASSRAAPCGPAAPPCSPSRRRSRGRARGAARASSWSSRASTLGSSIDWPCGSGTWVSTKAIDRYAGGTKSSRLTIDSSDSTPWSSTSQGRICCSIMLKRACSMFMAVSLRMFGSNPAFSPRRPAAGAWRRALAKIARFARNGEPALGSHPARQGRRHGHRRRPDRVPAGLEHRPPDPRRLAARLHRREEKVFDIAIQTGAILAVIIVYWQRLSSAVARPRQQRAGAPLRAQRRDRLPAGGGDRLALRQGDQGAPLHGAGRRHGLHRRRLCHPLGREARAARPPRIDDVDEMTPLDALKVGLVQCLGMIPGTSRSGATIIGGMLLGLSRKAATDFSFFLSIPTLIGAGGYSLWKERALLSAADLPLFAVGLLFSFLAAWFCVRWLLRYISTHTFVPFAWYRIAFGIVVLATAWSGLVVWSLTRDAVRRARLREDEVPDAVAAVAGRAARTWSAAATAGAARSRRRRVAQQRLGRQHLQHLLGVGLPVGRAVQRSRRARAGSRAGATNAGWIRRRLWCRFLCHGSGKKTWTPASERRRDHRLAAPRPRRAGRCARCRAPSSPMRFSSAPTPGGWTSMPRKSMSGSAGGDRRGRRRPCRSRSRPRAARRGRTTAREVERRRRERQHEARPELGERARLARAHAAGAHDEAADARRRASRGGGSASVGSGTSAADSPSRADARSTRAGLEFAPHAGVVQWQNGSFPSFIRGFDSLHPLQHRHRKAADSVAAGSGRWPVAGLGGPTSTLRPLTACRRG